MKNHLTRGSISAAALVVLSGTAMAQLGTIHSTALVQTYGADLQITDCDGDGSITDRDFLQWLRGKSHCDEIQDSDQDGAITHADAVADLAKLLKSLAGDFDGDGQVDGLDVTYVLYNIDYPDPTIKDGDINGDGFIDYLDATITFNKITAQLGDHQAVAQGLLQPSAWNVYSEMGAKREHLPFYSQAFPRPYDTNPFPFPNNHDRNITNAWFPTLPPGHPLFPQENMPPGNHWVDRSYNFWPPNHYKYASESWFPGVSWPSHFLSQSVKYKDIWPPNHLKTQSDTWPPNEHQAALSRVWPPNHTRDNSLQTPDHHELYSLKPEWQPGYPFQVPVRHPSPHDTTVSSRWPATHTQNMSRLVWPPNHEGSNSGSWPQGHLLVSSTIWPPNHFGGLSSTWPADTDPQWPANHAKEWSDEWPKPSPTPPPPWGDHTLFTTAQDIIPLIPVVP